MLSTLTIYKKKSEDIIHYIAIKNNYVIGSIELNKTITGHLWVRHSVSDVPGQGIGSAMYQIALSDAYPMGIMPSREVTSGYAINLWRNLWNDSSIIKHPIKSPSIYIDEFDEAIEEISSINSLSEAYITSLGQDCSYLNAVQQDKLIPHPFNHIYSYKSDKKINIIPANQAQEYLFKQAEKLFYKRYEKQNF